MENYTPGGYIGENIQYVEWVRQFRYVNVYMCTYCTVFGIESEVNVPFKDLLKS